MSRAVIVSTLLLVMAVSISMVNCGDGVETTQTPTGAPEPTIPAHFKTVSDENAYFSISFPPDWRVDWRVHDLSWIDGPEYLPDGVPRTLLADPPGSSTFVLVAGVTVNEGWNEEWGDVGMVLWVSTIYDGREYTLKEVADGRIEAYRKDDSDFRLVSRDNTTIGGNEAVIVEYDSRMPVVGEFRRVMAILDSGDTHWYVECSAPSNVYPEYEDTIYGILASFRLLR